MGFAGCPAWPGERGRWSMSGCDHSQLHTRHINIFIYIWSVTLARDTGGQRQQQQKQHNFEKWTTFIPCDKRSLRWFIDDASNQAIKISHIVVWERWFRGVCLLPNERFFVKPAWGTNYTVPPQTQQSAINTQQPSERGGPAQ